MIAMINVSHTIFGVGPASFLVLLLAIVARRALSAVPKPALLQESVAAVGAEFDSITIRTDLIFEFFQQTGREAAVLEVLQ